MSTMNVRDVLGLSVLCVKMISKVKTKLDISRIFIRFNQVLIKWLNFWDRKIQIATKFDSIELETHRRQATKCVPRERCERFLKERY